MGNCFGCIGKLRSNRKRQDFICVGFTSIDFPTFLFAQNSRCSTDDDQETELVHDEDNQGKSFIYRIIKFKQKVFFTFFLLKFEFQIKLCECECLSDCNFLIFVVVDNTEYIPLSCYLKVENRKHLHYSTIFSIYIGRIYSFPKFTEIVFENKSFYFLSCSCI